MSVSIRLANINDVETLHNLSITTFRDTFAHANKKEYMDQYIAEAMSIEQLTKELNDEGNKFFLAYIHDNLVGYTKMRTIETPQELKDRNPIEIERIYVLKEYHNKKVGAALMDHCINYAINNNYDIIWLGVWEHNYKAVDFYKRWGFTLFGSHIFMLGPDAQTDVLMKKELPSR
ncbi:MAG TPA: GNAT family N-acetyltransferase [Flavipsychrobacter sp.]|nr:GNAT family N-acetyltransferase [Flavipsychrobacter sp.]